MALAGKEEQEAVAALEEIYSGLVATGIVKEAEPKGEASSSARPCGAPVLSTKRFESIFSKELKNRERAAGPHEVTAEAMACLHDWDGTGCGGIHCQVCNFEAKDKSYTCKFDCGVGLCGKCWWKWKEKA